MLTVKIMKLPVTVLALAFAAGCGSATPTPQSARASARAGVALAATAWSLVANACIDVVETTPADAGADAIQANCAADLSDARTLILAAGEAVDTDWSPKAACDLAQGAELVANAAGQLPLSGSVKSVAADAVSIARAALGSTACGAQGDR